MKFEYQNNKYIYLPINVFAYKQKHVPGIHKNIKQFDKCLEHILDW